MSNIFPQKRGEVDTKEWMNEILEHKLKGLVGKDLTLILLSLFFS